MVILKRINLLYLGVKFWIDFDQEKFNNDTEKIEPAFQIKYIGIA